MCLGNSDPGGIPSPDTPTPPELKAYKLRTPSLNRSGFFFVSVNVSTDILRGCCYQVTGRRFPKRHGSSLRLTRVRPFPHYEEEWGTKCGWEWDADYAFSRGTNL